MLYSCKGGDYDGDGHADIIFADPANILARRHPQGKFTVIFGGARGAQPPTIFLAGTQNFGQHMGEVFHVGDFNGDGKADIATIWTVNANTAVLFNGGTRTNQMGAAPATRRTIRTRDRPARRRRASRWSISTRTATPSGWCRTRASTHRRHRRQLHRRNLTAVGRVVIKGRPVAPMLDGTTASTYIGIYAPVSAVNDVSLGPSGRGLRRRPRRLRGPRPVGRVDRHGDPAR